MRVTPELIRKYHRGRCTPEEAAAVEEWLVSANWPGDYEQPAEGEETLPGRWQPPVKGRRIGWYGVAAAIVLAVAAGAVFFFGESKSRQGQGPVASAETMRVIKTRNGELRQLTLDDGTIVYLNAAATLHIPARFSGPVREIRLSGEAYFEVAKDPSRPFIVRTPESLTRVLGTHFNLKAYTGEPTELVVSEGKVAFSLLSEAGSEAILTAGERAVTGGGGIIREKVYAGRYISWKEGRLVLDDLPLSSVAGLITRHYGVRVEIRDPALNARRYSGSFEKPTLEQLIEDVAYVTETGYILKDSVLILHK